MEQQKCSPPCEDLVILMTKFDQVSAAVWRIETNVSTLLAIRERQSAIAGAAKIIGNQLWAVILVVIAWGVGKFGG